MSKKLFTGAMAAMMATGMVTPAMAGTNVADLHKAAYEATQKALTEKTQLSINEARASILAFKAAVGTHADISTWSSMVDSVQHPIYVQVVDGILALDAKKAAGTKIAQKEVNALYELLYNGEGTADDISAEYLAGAKYGWSGLTDTFQNDLTMAALKAVETAKTAEEVAAARVLVEELATSRNGDAAKAAKNLEAEVVKKEEALKYDITVTKVTDVTKTYVDVKFTALVDAIENAKIEVVDNNGKVVEVEAVRVLIEGETEARFYFTKALASDPSGVWTVNGTKVDTTAKLFVKEFNAATTAIKLADVIKTYKSYVTSFTYDVERADNGALTAGKYAVAYYDAAQELMDTEEITTVEQIQTIINKGNKEVANASKVEPLVNLAKNGTLSQFTAALNEMGLDRVNAEWVSEYKTKIKTDAASVITVADVQARINTINVNKIDKLVDDAIGSSVTELLRADIEAAAAAVSSFMINETTDQKTAKEAKLKELNIALAVVRVNEAITQTQLKSALKNLETVAGTTTFNYSTLVNEDLMKEYLTAMQATKSVSVTNVQTNLTTGYTAAETAARVDILAKANAVNAIESSATQTQKDALITALSKLATVTAKAGTKFDATKLNAQLAWNYANQIKVAGTPNVLSVTNSITTVNNNIVSLTLSTVNTADELLAALQSSKLTLTNVVAANKAAYEKEIAIFKGEDNKDRLIKRVNEINYMEAIKSAKTVAEVKTALVNYVFSAKSQYNYVTLNIDSVVEMANVANLVDAARTDVAELLLEAKTDASAAADLLDGRAKVEDAINAANVKRGNLLSAVNTELVKATPSITVVVEVLEDIDANYKDLDSYAKLVIAEKFIANKPTKTVNDVKVFVDFTNFTAIRNLIAASK